MQANTGGNFCTVTGQPDWCSSSMPCQNGQGDCPVKHWCVCQWAFASYIRIAGGCDKIAEIECDATNKEAVVAYQASSDAEHQEALKCLKQRCNFSLIEESTTTATTTTATTTTTELPET